MREGTYNRKAAVGINMSRYYVPGFYLFLMTWLIGGCAATRHSAPDPKPQPLDGGAWEIVWEDNFDGKEIDTSKWNIDGDRVRRKGYWYREDAYLDGKGHLVLRTKVKDGRFTSGSINSAGKFQQRFGYWEIRCKFPSQEGHWPAFWLYTESVKNIEHEGRDGTEIDIMEKPLRSDVIEHNLHWDGYEEAHRSARKEVKLPGISEGFHTFAVQWTSSGYVFYVDGRETWRTKAGGISRVPQYIFISEEVDDWAGDILNANLPDYFLVDWVRVYKASSSQR